jgi:hypothetical protein
MIKVQLLSPREVVSFIEDREEAVDLVKVEVVSKIAVLLAKLSPNVGKCPNVQI